MTCSPKVNIVAKKKPTTDLAAEQSVALAEFAAKAQWPNRAFGRQKEDRGQLLPGRFRTCRRGELPAYQPRIKKKLLKQDAAFTVADTASIVMAIAESLLEGEPLTRLKLLFITKKLTDCLQDSVVPAVPAKSKAKKSKPTNSIYQFKITLLEAKPPIWRRIQVQDCTLDKLHEHIQTAMGWTNRHLHQFEIKGDRYGDPELSTTGSRTLSAVDSTKTGSATFPEDGKRFAFKYEYDFGDGWEHEVLFEGCPCRSKKAKVPIAWKVQRACPPEDCGGIWGYYDMLAALADPRARTAR